MTLLVLAASPARAGLITAEFEGILTTVMGVPGASAGTAFSGTYIYDDSAPFQTLAADSRRYDFGAGFPATGFSIEIHAAIPSTFAGAPLRDITLNDRATGDSMSVVATTGTGGDFRLDLSGGPSLLTSLDLAVPAGASGLLQYTNLTAGLVILGGTLTEITTAPEPTATTLLSLGLALLGWRRSHRRRQGRLVSAAQDLAPRPQNTGRTSVNRYAHPSMAPT
jgi:hypothetical protein